MPIKPPAGYTAEELERDNPYNQWMYEKGGIPTFLNDPEDVEWLLSTHLKGQTLAPFASFVLYGNEDAPTRLDLYVSEDPTYDAPCVTINLE
jgi:hypothetical protein